MCSTGHSAFHSIHLFYFTSLLSLSLSLCSLSRSLSLPPCCLSLSLSLSLSLTHTLTGEELCSHCPVVTPADRYFIIKASVFRCLLSLSRSLSPSLSRSLFLSLITLSLSFSLCLTLSLSPSVRRAHAPSFICIFRQSHT